MTRLTYLLLLALVFSITISSCSKDSDDTPQEEEEEEEPMNEVLSLTTSCKYEITLGDQTFASDPTNEWLYCATNRYQTTDAVGNVVLPGASIEDEDPLLNFYLTRGTLRVDEFGDLPSNADFENLFHTGTYSFTPEAADGIEIVMGLSGVSWSTSMGTAEQDGSVFTIMEMVSGEANGGYYASIRGEFTCKFYNFDGEMRTGSGKVTVQFQNF